MKSMEKLDMLREAGADPKLAEAIVRTQEDSDYITKDFLKGELEAMEKRLMLAMLGVAGLSVAIARLFG